MIVQRTCPHLARGPALTRRHHESIRFAWGGRARRRDADASLDLTGARQPVDFTCAARGSHIATCLGMTKRGNSSRGNQGKRGMPPPRRRGIPEAETDSQAGATEQLVGLARDVSAHTEASPRLTGGDVDADWQGAPRQGKSRSGAASRRRTRTSWTRSAERSGSSRRLMRRCAPPTRFSNPRPPALAPRAGGGRRRGRPKPEGEVMKDPAPDGFFGLRGRGPGEGGGPRRKARRGDRAARGARRDAALRRGDAEHAECPEHLRCPAQVGRGDARGASRRPAPAWDRGELAGKKPACRSRRSSRSPRRSAPT